MGLRKKPRIKMVVPIRIWGMDSTAKSFNILAYTLNVSSSGARIGGVKVQLGVGEAVTIQYKQKRALFKVVWLGRPGDPTQDQIGVALLEQDRQIWAEVQEPQTFLDDFVGERYTPPPPPAPAAVEAPSVPVEMIEAAEDAPPSAAAPPAALPRDEMQVLTAQVLPPDIDDTIRACARGLLHIEQAVKNTPPGAGALQEFRDAIARIRQTVWALQQWHEVKNETSRAFPLLSYLNSERLRFVAQATQDLADDSAKGVELDNALLEKFFRSAERLRSAVAPQDVTAETAPSDGGDQKLLQAVTGFAAEIQRSGMTVEAGLVYLARELHRLLSAQGVAIARWQEGEMLCLGSSGNAAEAGMVLETEAGLGGEAMQTGALIYCSDTQSDPRVDPQLCREAGIGSVVMVPAKAEGGAPAGMIEVSSARANGFEPAHLDALRAAAQVLAALLKARSASA